jgi:hypothetical protein
MQKVEALRRWNWHEVPLSSLKELKGVEDLFRKHRGDRPTGLLTEVEGTPIVVANLIAPINSVFWASPCRDDLWGDWASGRSVLSEQDLDQLAAGLRATIGRVTSYALELLGPVRMLMKIKSPQKGVGSDYARHRTVVMLRTEVGMFKRRFDDEARQFAKFAFFELADGHVVSYEPEKAIVDAQLIGLGRDFCDDLERGRRDLLDLLRDSVSRVQSKTFDMTTLSTKTIVGGFADFTLQSSCSGTAEAAEVLALRARFIRLLSWPVHYATVREVLHPLAAEDIRAYGIKSPVDLVGELEAYLRQMEKNYDVLRSTHF